MTHNKTRHPTYTTPQQPPANANVIGTVTNWHHKPKDTQ